MRIFIVTILSFFLLIGWTNFTSDHVYIHKDRGGVLGDYIDKYRVLVYLLFESSILVDWEFY